MEVSWIKLTTDMFDNRKIKHLRKLPDGNSIVLIWVMLLTMAGRCNAGGMVFLTETIPYTTKMLADELDFEESTVTLALKSLESLGMISSDPLEITNWEEYQNVDGMERIREQTRKRMAEYRARKKALEAEKTDSCVTGYVTVTQGYATEEEKEIDREIDKELRKEEKVKKEEKSKKPTAKEEILDIFNRFAGHDDELALALQSFAEMRKAIKKPLTVNAANLVCKTLKGFPQSDWIEIINQSILNSWAGLFPLKGESPQRQNARPMQESTVDRLARLMREGAFKE